MHREEDSARPENVLLERGFRPEHLTPRERVELAERLRGWPEPEAPSHEGHSALWRSRRDTRAESPGRHRS